MVDLSLSLILDGVILVLLVVTILYAARLSLYLKRFRDSRADLETIITDLSKQIGKADKAIATLHKTVDESGADLQARMDRAHQMYDELEMIVQSGDTMATRLENLATKNRKILEGGASDLDDLAEVASRKDGSYEQRVAGLAKRVNELSDTTSGEGDVASFFNIRDPDIERGEGDGGSGFELNDDDEDVLSEAERDLYKSLKNKKSRAGGKK